MVREILTDFIRRAERRLNRDVTRVYEYYETRREEIDRRARKKAARREGADIPAEDVAAEKLEALRRKREAVESEREWKIRDLIAKNALGIKLDPLCIIRIQATEEEPTESQGATNTIHLLFAGSSSLFSRTRTAMDEEAGKHP